MTIREALEIFGVENVRRAMDAFTRPSRSRWCGCFVGTGIGASLSDQVAASNAAAHWLGQQRSNGPGWNDRFWAMWVLSGAYEGARSNREELYGEAVAFLAEHGSHPEPVLFANCDEALAE